jgi:hypothetical protein
MIKKFARWENCIKESCPCGTYGKCNSGLAHKASIKKFPADGRCLYPVYREYSPYFDALGAFKAIKGETIIFAKLIRCLKQKCGEGRTGQCTRGYHGFNEDKQDFPADGMCLYPDYVDYDKEEDEMGVYEDTEKVTEVAV